MTVYDRLRASFKAIAELITDSERRGLAMHDGRPLSPSRNATWLPNAEAKLADALVYLASEEVLLDESKRSVPGANHEWLSLRACQRDIVAVIRKLRELDGREISPIATKREFKWR